MSYCFIAIIGKSVNFYSEKIFDILAVGTDHSFPGEAEVDGERNRNGRLG